MGEVHPWGVQVIDLDYAAELTDTTIDRLEEAARTVGLPLRELELIGQDAELADAFIESVQSGRHQAFVDGVDWTRLEGKLYGARSTRGTAGSHRPGVAPA